MGIQRHRSKMFRQFAFSILFLTVLITLSFAQSPEPTVKLMPNQVPCIRFDACGVCLGDNSTCTLGADGKPIATQAEATSGNVDQTTNSETAFATTTATCTALIASISLYNLI